MDVRKPGDGAYTSVISAGDRETYLSAMARQMERQLGMPERDAAVMLSLQWGWELPKKYQTADPEDAAATVK